MNENSSKQVLLSVLGIAVLVVAVVGVSFAFFTYSKAGDENNSLTTGSIFFNFAEGTAIKLTNQFPITDTQAENIVTGSTSDVSSITYTVTGYNTSDTDINYVITAVAGDVPGDKKVSGENYTQADRLPDYAIKLQLTGANATGGSTSPFSPQNLKVSYYPQRGTVKIFGGSKAQIDYIGEFIKENDTKQPQAYVDISIIELNEDGSKQFNNNWSASFGDISINANTDGTAIKHVHGTDRTRLNWDMNYLLRTAKARVLANPKLVVTNGKEALIDLTSDYIESVDVEYLQTGSTTASAIAQKTYNVGSDKGLKVSLTPFISRDGYVTVNVKPEYSTELEQVKAMEYGQNSQGSEYTAATLLSRRNLDVKNVRIKDGETLIIGGLIQEQTHKTVTKIPILGDIPGIGAAFRSSGSEKVKTELVILITPKIIKDNEDIGINNL